MPLLELRNISKQFPGVKALDDVNLKLDQGEVLALVGENGAGKSTLMNILSGIIKPDTGHLIIQDEEMALETYNPTVSIQRGIAHVHQELGLCANMSIAENIYFNRAPRSKFGLVDFDKMYDDTRKCLELFKIAENPRTILSRMSFGMQQQIEILKAITQDAKIIIFDEPTTGISESEAKMLFQIINQLKSSGIGFIYISHKLDEVMALADRITVLRDGKIIKTMAAAEATKEIIISNMVGRELNNLYPDKAKVPSDETVLEIKNLCVKNVLNNVSLTLKKGEILGIYGLVGAGRSELCDAIFGMLKIDSGTVALDGKPIQVQNTADAVGLRFAYLPEERKRQGLFLDMSIRQNIIAADLKNYMSSGFIMNNAKEKQGAETHSRRFKVVTDTIEKKVRLLSGGNQQKVMLAKWVSTNPKILIVDEPTKGIDVNAKSQTHKLLRELADEGVSIIMVSSELPEILGLSDRGVVMHEGRIKGEFDVKTAAQDDVMGLIMQKEIV